MTLIRYNPGFVRRNPLEDLQAGINRLFSFADEPIADRPHAPVLDLQEKDDKFIIQVDLPGVAKENVSISVHEGVLNLTGKREETVETTEEGYLHRERRTGQFARSIHLPSEVDVNAVTAAMKDGVLTIEAPKSVEAKPRTIEISAN